MLCPMTSTASAAASRKLGLSPRLMRWPYPLVGRMLTCLVSLTSVGWRDPLRCLGPRDMWHGNGLRSALSDLLPPDLLPPVLTASVSAKSHPLLPAALSVLSVRRSAWRLVRIGPIGKQFGKQAWPCSV
jgi:hypothetical protein